MIILGRHSRRRLLSINIISELWHVVTASSDWWICGPKVIQKVNVVFIRANVFEWANSPDMLNCVSTSRNHVWLALTSMRDTSLYHLLVVCLRSRIVQVTACLFVSDIELADINDLSVALLSICHLQVERLVGPLRQHLCLDWRVWVHLCQLFTSLLIVWNLGPTSHILLVLVLQNLKLLIQRSIQSRSMLHVDSYLFVSGNVFAAFRSDVRRFGLGFSFGVTMAYRRVHWFAKLFNSLRYQVRSDWATWIHLETWWGEVLRFFQALLRYFQWVLHIGGLAENLHVCPFWRRFINHSELSWKDGACRVHPAPAIALGASIGPGLLIKVQSISIQKELFVFCIILQTTALQWPKLWASRFSELVRPQVPTSRSLSILFFSFDLAV